MWTNLAGPTLAFDMVAVVLLLCILVRVLWERRPSAEAPWYVLLFFLALTSRYLVEPGPHDINNRSLAAVASVDSVSWSYGLGYPALGQVFYGLLPWPRDEAWLFELGAWMGALTPLALVAWLRSSSWTGLQSGLAGLMLALSSPHVLLSRTDAQQIPESLLTLLGLWLLSLHSACPRVLHALGAALALGLATHQRPECLALAPLLLGLLAVWTPSLPWRDRTTQVAMVLLVGLWVAHLGGMLSWHASGQMWTEPMFRGTTLNHGLWTHGPRHLIFIDPAWTPSVVVGLAMLGLLFGACHWRTRAGLAFTALAMGSVVFGGGWSPVDGVASGFARHQLRALPFFAALVGLGGAHLAELLPHRASGVVAVSTLFGLLGMRIPAAVEPPITTMEYAFVREALPLLPQPCTVMALHLDVDGALEIQQHLPRMMGLDLSWRELDEPVPSKGCVAYYRPANCVVQVAGSTVSDRCIAFEREHTLEPLRAHTTTPRPIYGESYAGPVRIGLYRLRTDSP